MHLLDVNLLIALGNRTHVHHQRTRSWFFSSCEAWATCPLTENGFVRIIGHPAYVEFEGGPEEAREVLQGLTAAPGHQFWADDLSLTNSAVFPSLANSKHLTDLYLLGLAVRRGGKFATLDGRIDANHVPGGTSAYFFVPHLECGKQGDRPHQGGPG